MRSLFERTTTRAGLPSRLEKVRRQARRTLHFLYPHHTTPPVVLGPQSKILLIFSCYRHTISSNPHMFSSR